jgi:pimeloyl-ACP methyl ester carboxylesterase
MQEILHSKIIGKGEPLLILHGLLGMGDNWVSFARQMAAESYQVHLIDQRNHGRSFHDDEMNYEVMVKDLERYMDYYQLNRVNLLGHSMGGKTAMFFSIKNPTAIKKLIIVDISPAYYPPHHHFIFEAIKELPLITDSRKELEKTLNQKIQNPSITQFILKNIKRNKENGFQWRPNIPVLEESLEELGDALPPMSVFDKETLFIKGEKSPYITQKDFSLIKAHFPKAEIKTIEGAGHWVHAEKPVIFKKIISEFLQNS